MKRSTTPVDWSTQLDTVFDCFLFYVLGAIVCAMATADYVYHVLR